MAEIKVVLGDYSDYYHGYLYKYIDWENINKEIINFLEENEYLNTKDEKFLNTLFQEGKYEKFIQYLYKKEIITNKKMILPDIRNIKNNDIIMKFITDEKIELYYNIKWKTLFIEACTEKKDSYILVKYIIEKKGIKSIKRWIRNHMIHIIFPKEYGLRDDIPFDVEDIVTKKYLMKIKLIKYNNTCISEIDLLKYVSSYSCPLMLTELSKLKVPNKIALIIEQVYDTVCNLTNKPEAQIIFDYL